MCQLADEHIWQLAKTDMLSVNVEKYKLPKTIWPQQFCPDFLSLANSGTTVHDLFWELPFPVCTSS